MKTNREIRLSELLPIVMLLAGLLMFPLSMLNNDFSRIPGDKGDARFNNYILEHGYKYYKGDVKEYWDAPFLYPHTNTIALSDNLLGTLPVYIFFREVKCDRETAFQWWFLSMFALNFIGCYIALRKWTGNALLSSSGAYVFAFSIYILGHINHVQILPKFIAPLVLYWLWKFLSEKKPVSLLLAVTGLTYQFYCGMYLGFFLFYVILFMGISYLIIYRDWEIFRKFREKKFALSVAGILVFNLLLLTPMMLHYLKVSGEHGYRSFEEISFYLPTWKSYFFATPESSLWNFLSWHMRDTEIYWWEKFLFIGIVPWISMLLLIALLFKPAINVQSRKFLGFLLMSFLLCVLFSVKFGGFTFYKLVVHLPGFGSMRSINRIINIIVILQVFMMVFSSKFLIENFKVARQWMVILPLLIIADNSVTYWERTFKKADAQNEVKIVSDRINGKISDKKRAVAYQHKNFFGHETPSHLNVMLACQDMNLKCVNAYTGLFPDNFQGFADTEGLDSLEKWMKSRNQNMDMVQLISEFDFICASRRSNRLVTINNEVVCRDTLGGGRLYLQAGKNGAGEYWDIIGFENGLFTFRTHDDRYVCAELSSIGEIVSNRETPGQWETFQIEEAAQGGFVIKAANGKYIGQTPDKKLIASQDRGTALRFQFQ